MKGLSSEGVNSGGSLFGVSEHCLAWYNKIYGEFGITKEGWLIQDEREQRGTKKIN